MRNIKAYLKSSLNSIYLNSLKKAAQEQGLSNLVTELEDIVPDISNQYSTVELDSAYLKSKARNLHAFQMLLVGKVIREFEKLTVVDIGDSAGTHSQYLVGLYGKHKNIGCISINLDNCAVDKIKQKGLEAIHARAEDLDNYNIDADIFLCFETIEHLMNPCHLLHRLSSKTNVKYLIITVPYLRHSRVGLHHIRQGRNDHVIAENTHIFELSPEDWKLIIRHSGWDIIEEKIYLQYPKRGFLRITKLLWRKFDFEGFYGLILKRDDRWSSKYADW